MRPALPPLLASTHRFVTSAPAPRQARASRPARVAVEAGVERARQPRGRARALAGRRRRSGRVRRSRGATWRSSSSHARACAGAPSAPAIATASTGGRGRRRRSPTDAPRGQRPAPGRQRRGRAASDDVALARRERERRRARPQRRGATTGGSRRQRDRPSLASAGRQRQRIAQAEPRRTSAPGRRAVRAPLPRAAPPPGRARAAPARSSSPIRGPVTVSSAPSATAPRASRAVVRLEREAEPRRVARERATAASGRRRNEPSCRTRRRRGVEVLERAAAPSQLPSSDERDRVDGEVAAPQVLLERRRAHVGQRARARVGLRARARPGRRRSRRRRPRRGAEALVRRPPTAPSAAARRGAGVALDDEVELARRAAEQRVAHGAADDPDVGALVERVEQPPRRRAARAARGGRRSASAQSGRSMAATLPCRAMSRPSGAAAALAAVGRVVAGALLVLAAGAVVVLARGAGRRLEPRRRVRPAPTTQPPSTEQPSPTPTGIRPTTASRGRSTATRKRARAYLPLRPHAAARRSARLGGTRHDAARVPAGRSAAARSTCSRTTARCTRSRAGPARSAGSASSARSPPPRPPCGHGTRLRRRCCARQGRRGGPGRRAVARRPARTRWSRTLPSRAESSPLLDRGRLYFGSENGTVYALRARDGAVRWTLQGGRRRQGRARARRRQAVLRRLQRRTSTRSAAPTAASCGRSAPAAARFGLGGGQLLLAAAVAYGRVYIGNTNGAVYSFAARNGKLAWRKQTGALRLRLARRRRRSGRPADRLRRLLQRQASTRSTPAPARVRWSRAAGGKISGGAIVIGDLVFVYLDRPHDRGRSTRQRPDGVDIGRGAFNPAISDGRGSTSTATRRCTRSTARALRLLAVARPRRAPRAGGRRRAPAARIDAASRASPVPAPQGRAPQRIDAIAAPALQREPRDRRDGCARTAATPYRTGARERRPRLRR